jgi:hypothetical protein
MQPLDNIPRHLRLERDARAQHDLGEATGVHLAIRAILIGDYP